MHADTRAPPGAAVLWLTGLSGAGKSTIAEWIVDRLRARHYRVEHLDGDAIRALFPDVGFDRASREAHVRRVGHLASRLEHHGIVVVASLISPYEASREFVRALCANFIEVHVATPLDECERRDPHLVYARARRGEIADVTGVDAPYECPTTPELRVDTTGRSIEAVGCELLQCFLETVGVTDDDLPAHANDGRIPWHGRIRGAGLIRATGMLWMMRLALWCVPFSVLLSRLDTRRRAQMDRRPPRLAGGRARVERQVRLGSRLVPRCTCLVQALVAEQLLTELGFASVVRLGATKTTGNALSAHAWVECEGKVVVGGDVSGFVEFRHAAPPTAR